MYTKARGSFSACPFLHLHRFTFITFQRKVTHRFMSLRRRQRSLRHRYHILLSKVASRTLTIARVYVPLFCSECSATSICVHLPTWQKCWCQDKLQKLWVPGLSPKTPETSTTNASPGSISDFDSILSRKLAVASWSYSCFSKGRGRPESYTVIFHSNPTPPPSFRGILKRCWKQMGSNPARSLSNLHSAY